MHFKATKTLVTVNLKLSPSAMADVELNDDGSVTVRLIYLTVARRELCGTVSFASGVDLPLRKVRRVNGDGDDLVDDVTLDGTRYGDPPVTEYHRRIAVSAARDIATMARVKLTAAWLSQPYDVTAAERNPERDGGSSNAEDASHDDVVPTRPGPR